VGQISTTVTNNKTAADAAFKTLTDNLNAEVRDRQALENAYEATWVYQNDHLLSLMAAQFNADGTIKGYSALTTKVDGIEGTVTSNKTAADKAIGNLNTWLGSLEDYIEDVDEEQEASATWIQQNKNKWSAVAASFDSNGNVTASGMVGVYVANQLSYFEVDADKINFNVGFEWSVKHDGAEIFHLDSNGNLTIMGTFTSTNGDSIVATDDGIVRNKPGTNTYIPLYAGRYMRIETRAADGRSYNLYDTDDMVLFTKSQYGLYILPTTCQGGKVLSLRNISGGTITIKPGSGQTIRDSDGEHSSS